MFRPQIDFEFNEAKYDSSNPLVLPGKNESRYKGKRQLDRNEIVQNQILSKKRRKELLRKVSQKEKKLSVTEISIYFVFSVQSCGGN